MKLAVMTYTLARQLKPGEAFDFCRLATEIGSDSIDVVTTYGQKPEEVRDIMDDHGVRAEATRRAAAYLKSLIR